MTLLLIQVILYEAWFFSSKHQCGNEKVKVGWLLSIYSLLDLRSFVVWKIFQFIFQVFVNCHIVSCVSHPMLWLWSVKVHVCMCVCVSVSQSHLLDVVNDKVWFNFIIAFFLIVFQCLSKVVFNLWNYPNGTTPWRDMFHQSGQFLARSRNCQNYLLKNWQRLLWRFKSLSVPTFQ